MSNRIILKVRKVNRPSDNLIGTVKITPEAELVLKQIQRETGLSARHIASQIIIQAQDLIEVEEE